MSVLIFIKFLSLLFSHALTSSPQTLHNKTMHFLKIIFKFFVVHVCSYVQVHTCAYLSIDQKTTSAVILMLFTCFFVCFETGYPFALGFTKQVWLASEPLEFISTSSTGIIFIHHYTHLFKMWFLGVKLKSLCLQNNQFMSPNLKLTFE